MSPPTSLKPDPPSSGSDTLSWAQILQGSNPNGSKPVTSSTLSRIQSNSSGKIGFFSFIKEYSDNLLCLQETHVSVDVANSFIHKFGRPWKRIASPSNGASGGIILVWNTNIVTAHTLAIQVDVIHAIIAFNNSMTFIISTIYANINPSLRDILCNLETKEATNNLSSHEQETLNFLFNKVTVLQRQISLKWWAKAKIKWYLEGDRNTVYFHRMVTSRRRINHIHSITSENGSILSDDKEILFEFSHFYQNLWTSPSDPFIIQLWPQFPSVSDSFKNSLIAHFSKAEIWNTISSMANGKSPGIDGFIVEFYKSYWKIISDDLLNCFHYFHSTGFIPFEWNKIILIFIPKCQNPDRVKDFRHIVLCNLSYRILTKLIANRLKTLTLLINKAVNDNIFISLRINNTLTISHLMFADDILLAFKADDTSISNFKTIFAHYAQLTGQKVNLQKSANFYPKYTLLTIKTNICTKGTQVHNGMTQNLFIFFAFNIYLLINYYLIPLTKILLIPPSLSRSLLLSLSRLLNLPLVAAASCSLPLPPLAARCPCRRSLLARSLPPARRSLLTRSLPPARRRRSPARRSLPPARRRRSPARCRLLAAAARLLAATARLLAAAARLHAAACSPLPLARSLPLLACSTLPAVARYSPALCRLLAALCRLLAAPCRRSLLAHSLPPARRSQPPARRRRSLPSFATRRSPLAAATQRSLPLASSPHAARCRSLARRTPLVAARWLAARRSLPPLNARCRSLARRTPLAAATQRSLPLAARRSLPPLNARCRSLPPLNARCRSPHATRCRHSTLVAARCNCRSSDRLQSSSGYRHRTEALIFAAQEHLRDVIIESDSKILMDGLNQKICPDWRILATVHDIFDLASKFNTIVFRFVYRECNKAAHWAANWARVGCSSQVLSSIRPPELEQVIVLLCFAYKLADHVAEGKQNPCYCSYSPSNAVATTTSCGGEILVLSMISDAELHIEDISDTLYSRPSVVSQISKSAINELRSLKLVRHRTAPYTSEAACATRVRVVERPQRIKTAGHKRHSRPRWSDCACDSCTTSSDALHVHVESPQTDGKAAEEDVVFIHGFISSSKFWTETVFCHFTDEARARYRLIAVDLLGFANSPKPEDSLYTLEEHVRMLEKCVLERYNVKSFHIVAHSLGSLLALALAVKYPAAVKSLTIVAPPYFPVPEGEQGTQYVLRRLAPRRVWPLLSFGSSMVCWYEHISRTACLLICKQHRLWTAAFKFLTRNRVRTYLMEGFFSYTHNAAWHTLHNVICGTGGKVVDGYLEALREEMSCDVVVYHGRDDELLPVDCSYAVKSRIPRARVKVVEDKDHITIVVGRQKAFARELEEIWSASTTVTFEQERKEMGIQ
ncbi:putative lysophospholipase BODYGUARD 2 isoform X1 [Canna indica]|uniref:Lysophospholipase BODYGUARD 2 isoform X1 n=1 Tax=Canna indica TaxID=4628 RepID=A0AAQ3KN16_9LILI|nr:putative lysophospholipase BODYGUARD 2 isoform X1 [Canna indica]